MPKLRTGTLGRRPESDSRVYLAIQAGGDAEGGCAGDKPASDTSANYHRDGNRVRLLLVVAAAYLWLAEETSAGPAMGWPVAGADFLLQFVLAVSKSWG